VWCISPILVYFTKENLATLNFWKGRGFGQAKNVKASLRFVFDAKFVKGFQRPILNFTPGGKL
jgi:hypothetical protein